MLIDTNFYVALNKSDPIALDVLGSINDIQVPLPVIAELRYGFANGSRREQNEAILQKFLAEPRVSIIEPSLTTTKYYAELQKMCRDSGRVLSHNDIWIASLAREIGQPLVTFDQDFEVFKDAFGDKLIILIT